MSRMNFAALSTVARVNPGLDLSNASPTELVDFLPMAGVDARYSSVTAESSRPLHEVQKGFTAFTDEDVLVAKITPCFENGKISQVRTKNRFGFGSTEFHVIRAHKEKLDPRYLVNLLRCERILIEGERKMTGSAGQRRVPKHFLETLELPIPSLANQKRIATIFDQADALRTTQRETLAQLDSLAQTIFVEMFGDPATNSKNWPIKKIGDLLTSASYGTSEKSNESGEFPVLRMNNLTRTGEIDLTDLKYMDMPIADHERYLVKVGDVLFNRTNSADLVGKTAIFRHDMPMAYAGYLIRLRVNAENDPEYLAFFLNTQYSKRMLRAMCKSIIGMANINATEIQAMKIPKPPLDLQQKFAERIRFIEQQKAVQRQQISELNTLFTSLQHRAFRGEL